jgi:asparagine synthase (glutamine-hydrolysing)
MCSRLKEKASFLDRPAGRGVGLTPHARATQRGALATYPATVANFIALIDPDAERRGRFANAVAGHLALHDGLVTGSCDAAHIAVRWAAASTAPVSSYSDENGAGVLFGQAIDAASEPIDARTLASRWKRRGDEPPFAHDGFHAGLVYDAGGHTIVAADLLGFFPVYYAHVGPVLIVGSSAELFRHHPLFNIEVDPQGLVTLLMTGAPLDGRSLLRGVRRLEQSHALVFRPSEGRCHEVRQFTLSEPTTDAAASFDEATDELDAAVSESLRRQVRRNVRHVLLLSGGRDSRFLGGYLREQGHDVVALTLAERDDYETTCARAVSRALRLPWHRSGFDQSLFEQTARRQARWEHLGGGFNIVLVPVAPDYLRRLGDRVVTGLLLDVTLSGRPTWPRPAAFEKLLSGSTGRNIPPDVLTGLLAPGLSALPGAIVERMRVLHRDASEIGSLRTWRYQLAHSDSYSVGTYAWRLSFGAWPVVPVLSRAYLTTCTSLPPVVLSGRRAQDALLRRRFPDLARIPHVESNAGIAPPLAPSAGYRLRAMLRSGGGLWPRPDRVHADSRYHLNYRMYDFNSSAWRAVRRDAEVGRSRLAPYFDMDALERYLPAPDVVVPTSDPFTEMRGRMMLVGLMLWANGHLP